MSPEFIYICEIRAEVVPPIRVGEVDGQGGGDLSVAPITGGTVTGDRITGKVLPVGADWWVCTGPTTRLDARYLLETDDGAVIDILNRGYYRATKEVMDRVEAGENVPEGEYYFRCSPTFQTDAPAHRWLAENQFVGLARDEDGQVCMRMYVLR